MKHPGSVDVSTQGPQNLRSILTTIEAQDPLLGTDFHVDERHIDVEVLLDHLSNDVLVRLGHSRRVQNHELRATEIRRLEQLGHGHLALGLYLHLLTQLFAAVDLVPEDPGTILKTLSVWEE